MTVSLKFQFIKQCQLVSDSLEKKYPEELNYNGTIKTIHSKFIDAIKAAELCDNLNSISFRGFARMFVDDTTNYMSPIIKEMEKAEVILKQIQKSNK